MKGYLRFSLAAALFIAVLELLPVAQANSTAQPALSAPCDMRLRVELTPDVPDPSNAGFVSSLLGNHSDYRLSLLREIDPSVIEVDLAGPGPDYLCQNVIDAMRKDGRVLSIDVDSLDARASSVATPRPAEEEPQRVQLSSSGIGSLYWALRHPGDAWKVVLPIPAGEEPAE